MGQTDQKTDAPCAEKMLMEEKAKLEEQLKDTMVGAGAGGGSVERQAVPGLAGPVHVPAKAGARAPVLRGSDSAMRLLVTCYVDGVELRLKLVFTYKEHQHGC